jgi:hypothetical protein
VLELHSRQGHKLSVLKELAHTLEQGKPLVKDGAEELHTLSQVRDQLNQYCEAVNAEVQERHSVHYNARALPAVETRA